MEKSGVPLELRTRRALQDRDYDVKRDFYTKNDKVHEVDFLAEAVLDSVELPYRMGVDFHLYLIGQCKHSETHDVFLFKAENPERFYFDLPIRLDLNPTFIDTALKNYYSFPFIGERFVEVGTDDFLSRHKDNYNDRLTYLACQSLAAALEHYQQYFAGGHHEVAEYSLDELRQQEESLKSPEVNRDPRAVVRRLMKEDPESVFRAARYFEFDFAIPMLVLDNNKHFIETILSNEGQVKFERDLDVALYPHVEGTTELVWSHKVLPVVVCKQSSLDKALSIIESGSRAFVENSIGQIRKNQSKFVEDFLVAEIKHQTNQDASDNH